MRGNPLPPGRPPGDSDPNRRSGDRISAENDL